MPARLTPAERESIAVLLREQPLTPLATIATRHRRSLAIVWRVYRAELAAGRVAKRLHGRPSAPVDRAL